MVEQLFNALKAIETLSVGHDEDLWTALRPGPGPRAVHKLSWCPQLLLDSSWVFQFKQAFIALRLSAQNFNV